MTRHPLRLAIGRRIAAPRFLAFLAILIAASFAHHHFLPASGWPKALAVGFDVAAFLFLASLIPLLRDESVAAIRARAMANNANRVVVLSCTSLLTLVVMAAIADELPAARHGDALAIAELIVTLLLIWLFANSVYALHYAHDYYTVHEGGKDCGGLDFPQTPEPGYGDFAYFAFTLGMTFQTSDTAITASRIRSIALLHSFAAFVFNIGVIAFTINALGGGSS